MWHRLYGILALTIIVLRLALVTCRRGYGPGEQDWGFVDVRPGAHMFYWLYYTTASNVSNYTERPLAIWLQGGPGVGSTGLGNFQLLGPLAPDGSYRNHTWVKDMNVLFIDSPVGAGFSYVDDVKYLTTKNNEIAMDLVAFMKEFYALHPEFEEVPVHIFSESYGGKMAPEFALEFYYAIQRGELRSNLKSVAVGNPWTSPIDTVMSYAPFLLQAGIVDQDGYKEIMAAAEGVVELIKEEKWSEADAADRNLLTLIHEKAIAIDIYNFMNPAMVTNIDSNNYLYDENFISNPFRNASLQEILSRLDIFMASNVSEVLNIPENIKYGSQRKKVRNALSNDVMKSVTHIVSELLDRTNLKVGVYSGQFDIICATPGTVNWVNKMNWSYKSTYEATRRRGIRVNKVLEGYEKSAGNFSMFWINRSGHTVPSDNPAGMSHILKKFTNFG